MKLKYNFVVNEVAGQSVAIPVGALGKFSGMIKLNESAAFIFSKLKEDISYDELLTATAENFSCTEDEAKPSVDNIVNGLRDADLLEGKK